MPLSAALSGSPLSQPSRAGARISAISSHLHVTNMSSRKRVVVTRNLGPDVMPLLLENPELDVSI